jgi:glyoxylase-like metal-dependent hydrolase (beta-lactamase superfamily II)
MEAGDVTHVVLSHLHFDHCGGIVRRPHRRFSIRFADDFGPLLGTGARFASTLGSIIDRLDSEGHFAIRFWSPAPPYSHRA